MKKILYTAICSLMLQSCDGFLDKKSDMALTIPESVKDVRAMLDFQSDINDGMPGLADIISDDYFVDYQSWKSRPVVDQVIYTWDEGQDSYHGSSWSSPYKAIMVANVVLEALDRISGQYAQEEVRQLKGEALFIRALNHFLLSQLFCAPYDSDGDNLALGIPIRTSSDMNVVSVRSTIKDSYAVILKDLEEGALLLPKRATVITRPDLCALFALLSRVYLSMQDYEKALYFAEEALSIKKNLLDYNTLDTLSPLPFSLVLDNPEIIYWGRNLTSATFIAPQRGNVDTLLLETYEKNDLRQKLFFQDKNNGYKAFKGHYSQFLTNLFGGLAIDEVYLTAAECYARLDAPEKALERLNELLEKRYKRDRFEPYVGLEGVGLLDRVLLERRKQLLFRGVRWMDLRRLNLDPRYRKTLYRRLNNGNKIETYQLPPNDLRYVHLIPKNVIDMTNMPQNPR